jgi:Putative transposase/Transposase zinc-binding domain
VPASVQEYQARRPEEGLLYAVVAEELETFLGAQRERGHEIPGFVEREFRAFLDCGVLARGLVRVHCDSCGLDRVIGFSCKRRGWCPSCGGRRMSDTAAHLVDRVLPDVPFRQWVLSVPHALRYRLAYDARLLGQVFGIFARVVFQLLRRKAREYSIPKGQCGAVGFVQRFGSALNLHVHSHMLVLDGVYAALEGEAPRFYSLHAPEEKEVAWVAGEVAERTAALLERLGQSGAGEEDRLSRDDPWLAGLYAAGVRGTVATGARAGRRVQTAGLERNPTDEPAPSGPRCANAAGFSVHANVAIREHRREQLERLCRYMCRPPLAIDRLGRLPDGRLTYRMKTPWRDGTTHVIFSASEFLEKLAALVPAPRAHLVRFYGVLAPAAKWRPRVVPMTPTERSEAENAADNEAGCTHAHEPENGRVRRRRNYAWAELMKRVWAIDVLECPRCFGRMRLVAAIRAENTLRRILECLALPSRAPPVSSPRRSRIVSAEG